jgi:hypothetical protein
LAKKRRNDSEEMRWRKMGTGPLLLLLPADDPG